MPQDLFPRIATSTLFLLVAGSLLLPGCAQQPVPQAQEASAPVEEQPRNAIAPDFVLVEIPPGRLPTAWAEFQADVELRESRVVRF